MTTFACGPPLNTLTLPQLIESAKLESVCGHVGHDWRSTGGRACPADLTDSCDQAVYQCARCGDVDYGEEGGPGWLDCDNTCTLKRPPLQE